MAISLATNADWLIRTTGLVDCKTGPSTTMFWVKLAAAGAGYRTQWLQIDDPATYQDYVGWFSHVAATDVYGSAALAGVAADSTNAIRSSGQWMHLTLIRSVANVTFVYVNGMQLGSMVKNLTTATLAKEYLGNDTFSDGGCTIAYARQWNAVVSNAQIAIEMQATSAVQTTNLWGDWPLTSDINDTSGNGRNWTQVGSGSFVAGPTFPVNNSAANAIALGTTDSVTLDMNDGAYAWYSYTPVTDAEVVLGFWAFYDFAKVDDLLISVFQGPTSSPQLWPNTPNGIAASSSVPYQIPLTFGTTIYIQLSPHNIAATPFTSDVEISTLPGPTESVQAGDIAVNDDLDGFPLALLSQTTAAPRLFMNVVAGGSGTVMPGTGEVFLVNARSDMKLYTNQYELIATVPFPQTGTNPLIDFPQIVAQTDTLSTFYSLTSNVSSHTVLNAYSKVDGSVTGTWTLTQNGVTAGCPNPTNTKFYYTSSSSAIHVWDLVNDVALADVPSTTPPAGYVNRLDLLYLGDGTLLRWRQHPAATFKDLVENINPTTGAVIHSYDITVNNALNNGQVDHLATAIDDPNSFWVWIHEGNSTGLSQFLNIEVATGTVLTDPPNGVIAVMYEQGQYGGDFTSAPSARFGHSNSCPFWITRADIAPPTPTPGINTTEYLIRRERTFPVINQEQFRMFFSLLQIDLQAGNGLGNVASTVQGYNPILELDWSDDGGWTWSNIRFLDTGKVGQYSKRAIARMLGSSRGRVFRIAVSDPVQWAILNGYFQMVVGTS